MCVEVPHLRYVVAAADHPSFRRAALALNIAQPTLSKRIRELEERLGVALFERSTGGAQLTPLGKDFVDAARRVLVDLETMEHRARAGRSGDTGRLDIGFYTSLSTGPLRDAILSFGSQHPNVEINLIEDSRRALISLLDRGAVDIVVMLGEPNYSSYAYKSLWSDRIMVALPREHPLATREFVYWTDLKHEQFLLSQRDPGPEIQDVLVNKLTSPGDRPRIKPIKAHREHILSMVAGNRGVALVCECAIGIALQGIVFREVRDGNGPTRIGYVTYWRSNGDNPVLTHFIDILQKPVVAAH